MKYLFFILNILCASVNAQSIRGAEFYFEKNETLTTVLTVVFEDTYKDSVEVDWGDGTDSFLTILSHNVTPNGFTEARYLGDHNYSEEGYYEIVYTDGFVIEEVDNFNYTSQARIILKDTVGFFFENFYLSSWRGPEFLTSQESVQYDSGILTHYLGIFPFPIGNYIEREIISYPTDIYVDVIEGISITGNHPFMWTNPSVEGTFGTAIRVKYYATIPNDKGGLDSVFLCSTTRAFMIEITSDMVVGVTDILNKNSILLYPNPATNRVKVKYESSGGELNLSVSNLQGQSIFSSVLPTGSTNTEIDVSEWPAGIYFLELESAQGSVVQKLVVE